IDACDEVMDKVGRKRGLIRYDSMVGIETGHRRIFTPRVLAYTAVLSLLVIIDLALLVSRSDVETIILRSPGQLYQEVDATHLSNLYTYQMINKTASTIPVELKLVSPEGQIKYVGSAPDSLYKEKVIQGAMFITLETSHLTGRKTPIRFEVYSNGKKVDEVKTNFMGPGR
ncbi:MAG TPA: FixG Ig-like domain-containing protein, partial [Saprospiraceae bacterium]|nr:FixG Ig-like domain-containing protein [Saprospiraceae bacterium]